MPEVRLIDANALKQHYNVPDAEGVFSYCDTIMRVIDSQPTIEAEPVRHGHWANIAGMNNTVFCSECLAAANKELAAKYKGCPFCLARMDGGADNG